MPLGIAVVGLAFGATIWTTMDLQVLPLGAAIPIPASSGLFIVFLLEHAALIRVPIAWITAREA